MISNWEQLKEINEHKEFSSDDEATEYQVKKRKTAKALSFLHIKPPAFKEVSGQHEKVRELIENALSKRTKIADKKGTYRGWGGGDDGENEEGYVMVGLPAIHEAYQYLSKKFVSEVVRNTIANKEAAVLMIDEGKPDGAMNVSFAVPKLEENKENNDDEENDGDDEDEESNVNSSKKIAKSMNNEGRVKQNEILVTTPRSENESVIGDRQELSTNMLHEGKPTNNPDTFLSPKKACKVCGTPEKSSKKSKNRLSTKSRSESRLKIFKSNVKSGPNLDRQGPNPKSKSESRSRRKSTDFSGNSNNGKKNGNKNEINDRQKTLVPEENINGKHVTIKVDKANSKKIMSNEDATKKMILDNHKEGDDFACPFGECTEFDLVSLEAVVEHLKVSHQNYQLPITKKEEVFFCPFSNCEEPLETLFDVYEHMMIVLEIMSMKKAIAASKSQPTSELRQMLCTPRNTLLKAKSDSGIVLPDEDIDDIEGTDAIQNLTTELSRNLNVWYKGIQRLNHQPRIQDEKSQLDSNIGQNIKQEDIDKTLAKLTELNLFEQFKSKKNIGQKIQEPKKVENNEQNKMTEEADKSDPKTKVKKNKKSIDAPPVKKNEMQLLSEELDNRLVAVSKIGFGEGTTFEFYLKMNKGKYFGMFSFFMYEVETKSGTIRNKKKYVADITEIKKSKSSTIKKNQFIFCPST